MRIQILPIYYKSYETSIQTKGYALKKMMLLLESYHGDASTENEQCLMFLS